MPVHDWTRVDAGTLLAFHTAWNSELMKALNQGMLPADYYALCEQVAARRQTDVLTLQRGSAPAQPATRRVTVRHVTDHRVVATIEVTSPANKDRRASVREFTEKVVGVLEADIHVLIVDLLPPGRHDPQGMHGVIWGHFDPTPYQPPPDEPFTLASYRWDGSAPEAFVEPVGLGRPLIDMPLFLSAERYVNVPLERTYAETLAAMPAYWREVLEAPDCRPDGGP